MTDPIRLDRWEDFEGTFVQEEEKASQAQKSGFYVPDILYRGHSKSEWNLETTLERYTKKPHSWKSYHRVLGSVAIKINSLIGNNYEVPEFEIKNPSDPVPPAYAFMIYLRHHGFPSPLLDWTVSPYIAAFFAFSDAKEDSDVAIFSYREYLDGGKGYMVGASRIATLGPYTNTHKRHFLQQCQYTICISDREGNKDYRSHEEVPFNDEQDILTKYVLPYSEKEKVLKKLSLMNINSYSLFGSEDSLMSMLAYQEIET